MANEHEEVISIRFKSAAELDALKNVAYVTNTSSNAMTKAAQSAEALRESLKQVERQADKTAQQVKKVEAASNATAKKYKSIAEMRADERKYISAVEKTDDPDAFLNQRGRAAAAEAQRESQKNARRQQQAITAQAIQEAEARKIQKQAALEYERDQARRSTRTSQANAADGPVLPKSVGETSSVVGTLATSIGGIIAKYLAWGAAIGAVKKGLTESIGGYAEEEQAVNRLTQALIQNGTYTAGHLAHLDNLATQYKDMTGMARSEWLEVFRKLTQFGADSSNIERYASAVKNLSGIYGSTEQATLALQKALEGNFETFREHGIYVDQSATQAQKLASVLSQLETLGGGQLESKMEGLAGAWKKLSSEGQEAGVNIGRFISQSLGLETALRSASYVLGGFAEWTRKAAVESDGSARAAERHTRSLHDQKVATEAVNRELKSMKERHEDIRTALSNELNIQNALNDSQQSAAERARSRAQANLRNRVERGMITPQRALVEGARIDQAFDARQTALRQERERNESANRDQMIVASQAAETEIQNKIKAAEAEKKKRDKIAKADAAVRAARSEAQRIEEEHDSVVAQAEALRRPNMGGTLSKLGGNVVTGAAAGAMIGGVGAAPGALVGLGTGLIGAGVDDIMAKNLAAQLLEGQDLKVAGARRRADRIEAQRKSLGDAPGGTEQATEEKLRKLKEELEEQKVKTARARGEAATGRQISETRIRTEQEDLRGRTTVRQLDLGTDLHRVNTTTPVGTLSPTRMIQQSETYLRQVALDFATAIRGRDAITAGALLAIMESMGLNRAADDRLKAQVKKLEQDMRTLEIRARTGNRTAPQ